MDSGHNKLIGVIDEGTNTASFIVSIHTNILFTKSHK